MPCPTCGRGKVGELCLRCDSIGKSLRGDPKTKRRRAARVEQFQLDGPKIKRDREALGLSLEDAAALFHLEPAVLAEIEGNARTLTVRRAQEVNGAVVEALRSHAVAKAAQARLAQNVPGASRPPMPSEEVL